MKMIIGGKAVDSSDKRTAKVMNPSTGEVFETVPLATAEDVHQALEIAQKGKRIWGKTPVAKRAEILGRASQLLTEEQETLTTLLAKEAGKVYAQALAETSQAIEVFRDYGEKAKYLYGTTVPGGSDLVMIRREPLGVIANIMPYNFPVSLYSHKAAPALAMGNAVIMKPASNTPLTAIYLTDLLIRAGVPGEAVQVITGSGAVIGRMLSDSPLVNAISMTGSTASGIDIMEHAAKNMTRVFFELGGNDAFVIFDDVDIEQAVNEAIAGRLCHSGQVCCSSKRFIIQNNIKEAFTKSLAERLAKVKIGDTLAKDTEMGPLISEKAALEVEEQVALTVSQGAQCILGGKKMQGSFFPPTVLTQVTPDMDIAKNLEIFGPVFPIIGFDTEEEALTIANQSVYGLSAGVLSKDMKRAMRFAEEMEAGTVVTNGCSRYRVCAQPFGGHKMSGLGNEGYYGTLEELSQVKSVVIKNIL